MSMGWSNLVCRGTVGSNVCNIALVRHRVAIFSQRPLRGLALEPSTCSTLLVHGISDAGVFFIAK